MRSPTSSTGTTEGADLRVALRSTDLGLIAIGSLLTLAFVYEITIRGGHFGLGFLLAFTLFAGATYAFLTIPHVAIAFTIPFFAILPSLKILVSPQLGPTKDGIVLAATVAGLATFTLRRRTGSPARGDRLLVTATALLLALYVINVAGAHNTAWLQGVRLVGEPLLLLLAGLALAKPRRSLRWAVISLVATGCFVAGFGIVEQALGQWRLASYGYKFNQQIRTINGHLRSFGTMDDPFAYASFLMLVFAAVIFGIRRSGLAVACGVLIVIGVAVSYVRTAALIAVALVALELARRKRIAVAAALMGAVAIGVVLLLTQSKGTNSRTYSTADRSAAITINGRTSAWKAALGSVSDWPFGRGVGEVGTAASRAGYSLTAGSVNQRQRKTLAVDSGYFATIADVGFVGLAVLLAIFGRALALGVDGVRRGLELGWLAVALVAVMTLDALARASFTGFPSAFLGMLLLGLTLAALQESEAAPAELRRA